MGLIVLACFFLSGASGLVFEVLWTRELGLVFGSTSLAMATVLSAFMGGLALGSHLAGRLADRITHSLRLYGLAEAGVGLYALLIPEILRGYPRLAALLFQHLGGHPTWLSLVRFAMAAALLLLPTTLMGATLPLLSRYVVQRRARPGDAAGRIAAHVGALFTLNTTGAVLGTFLAGFVLLPLCGVRLTNLLAASTNLTLAAVVLLGGRRPPGPAALPDAPPEAEPEAEAEAEVGFSPLERRAAVAAYGVSGAVAMTYQVLWTRALAIVLGSSVYSFTLILLAFLLGLSGGAALATRLLPRLTRPMLALGIAHLWTLMGVVLSYLTLDKLPAAFLFLLRGGSFSVGAVLFAQFLLAALALLPATFAMGTIMPLTLRVYNRRGAEHVGRDVGDAYTINTIGAIAGSFAAGFLVLPGLGLSRGLLTGALCTALLAALLLGLCERRRLGLALGAAVVLLGGAFFHFAPPWNLSHFSAGLFRIALASDIIAKGRWPVPDLLFYHDGTSTTVSVERWGKVLALKNNGKVDASNSDDMPTQIMVGLMPLLLHPEEGRPLSAAVIGYGSGVTAGAVTQGPVGRVDVVELEPKVVEAGDRFFGDVNHRPSQDPRVRVIIGDGRNFLAQGSERYDVIISEPSNPWITGVSSLFTVDYWREARARLRDDGVFCQWAQLYELSQGNIKTLLRSFSQVFPYAYAFSAEHQSSDVILVASPRPLPLDFARLARRFAEPRLAAELRRAKVQRPEEVLADLLLTPAELPAFSAGAPLNTDDNARIEFAAPRDLLGIGSHDPYIHRVYGSDWPYARALPYLSGVGAVDAAPGELRRADVYARLSLALLSRARRPLAAQLLARAKALGGGGPADEAERVADYLADRDPQLPEVPLREGEDLGPDGVLGLFPIPVPKALAASEGRIRGDLARVREELAAWRFAHALKALTSWPEAWVEGMGPRFQLLLGYLLYRTELYGQAVDRLRPLLRGEQDGGARALLYYLARSEFFSGETREGVAHMREYLEGR